MTTVAIVAVFIGLVMLAYRVWRLENTIRTMRAISEPEAAPAPDDATAVMSLAELRTVTLDEMFEQHIAPDLSPLIHVNPRIVGPAS